jgi:hypothetical protein
MASLAVARHPPHPLSGTLGTAAALGTGTGHLIRIGTGSGTGAQVVQAAAAAAASRRAWSEVAAGRALLAAVGLFLQGTALGPAAATGTGATQSAQGLAALSVVLMGMICAAAAASGVCLVGLTAWGAMAAAAAHLQGRCGAVQQLTGLTGALLLALGVIAAETKQGLQDSH